MHIDSRDSERGAFEVAGAIIALGLMTLAVIMGTNIYRQTSLSSINAEIHERERISADSLQSQLRQDAATAQTIYYPSDCAAAGPCDHVRFGAILPNKTWAFWGYYSDPQGDKIWRCSYATSEATACSGAAQDEMDGAVTFRSQAVAATAIAARIPALATSGVTDYAGNLGYGVDDVAPARVVASNRVVVVQFANSTVGNEVHLLSNALPSKVALVDGSYQANGRLLTAQNAVTKGNSFSFTPTASAAQSGTAFEPRYVAPNIFNVGTQPASSGSTYACMSGASNIATVSMGAYSYPGATATLPFSVAPTGYGTCSFAFTAQKGRANLDTASGPLFVTSYGPVVINPAAINVWQTESGTAPISQAGVNGPFSIVQSTCGGGKATVSVAGNTLSVVGGNAPTTCTATVQGAGGVTTVETIKVVKITYVQAASPIGQPFFSGTQQSYTYTNIGSDGRTYPVSVSSAVGCTVTASGSSFLMTTAYSPGRGTCSTTMSWKDVLSMSTLAALPVVNIIGHQIIATNAPTVLSKAKMVSEPFTAKEVSSDGLAWPVQLAISAVTGPCMAWAPAGWQSTKANAAPLPFTIMVPVPADCTATIADNIGSPTQIAKADVGLDPNGGNPPVGVYASQQGGWKCKLREDASGLCSIAFTTVVFHCPDGKEVSRSVNGSPPADQGPLVREPAGFCLAYPSITFQTSAIPVL